MEPPSPSPPPQQEGLQAQVLRSLGCSAAAVLGLAVLLAGARECARLCAKPPARHLRARNEADSALGPLRSTLALALVLYLAGRWVARRLDVHWEKQQLRFQWRDARPAFAEAPVRLRPGRHQPAPWRPATLGDDSWRSMLPAAVLEEVDALSILVVEDFVVSLWYSNVSSDPQVPEECQRLLGRLLGACGARARAVNLGALLVRDVADTLREQLELARRLTASIGAETLGRLEAEAQDRAFAAELSADGQLVAAAQGPAAELAALRRVTDAVLPHVLAAQEARVPLLRGLLRELLAAFVLRPLLGFACPFWINKAMLHALRSRPPAPDSPGHRRGGSDGSDAPSAPPSPAPSEGPLSSSGPSLPPPPPGGALAARVTGSRVVRDAFSEHVAYEVVVSDGAATWVVHRRFSHFEALHRHLRPLRARGRYRLPPKRILSHATGGGFMATRKELLDRYLRDLLGDPLLAFAPALWDFLSPHSRGYGAAPGGVLKTVHVGVALSLDSAASAVSSGLHAVRAELSDAGRKLLAAGPLCAASPLPPPPAPAALPASPAPRAPSTVSSDEDGASEGSVRAQQPQPEPHTFPSPYQPPAPNVAAYEAGDPAGLAEPLLDLCTCVFRLHDLGFVQRQVLAFARALAELLVGGALDDALAGRLARLRTATAAAAGLKWVRTALWPGGVWYRTRLAAEARARGSELPPPAPPGFGGVPLGREAEAAEDARSLCRLLLERSPAAEKVVGRDAYRAGTLELFQLLQSPLLTRQIGWHILEAVLAALFPEVAPALLDARSSTGA